MYLRRLRSSAVRVKWSQKCRHLATDPPVDLEEKETTEVEEVAQPAQKRYPMQKHMAFLGGLHRDEYDPQFLRHYQVLYFLMSFLMRHRRNLRYVQYLYDTRKRQEKGLELEPSLGAWRTESEIHHAVVNLYQLKREYLSRRLSKDLGTVSANMEQLRKMPQMGTSTDSTAYRDLLYTTSTSLRQSDFVRKIDDIRPGPQGRLVQFFRAGARKQRHGLKFTKRSTVRAGPVELDEDNNEEDSVKSRVRGTMANLMPRRQLRSYYRVYNTLKAQGKLPAPLVENPKQAMFAFYRHWVRWTLNHRKQVQANYKRRFFETKQLATRMVRFHERLVRSRVLHAATGMPVAPSTYDATRNYRLNVQNFFNKVLPQYFGDTQDLAQLLKDVQHNNPPNPRELFDRVWRSVFKQTNPIVSWRTNKHRRNHLRIPRLRQPTGKEVEWTNRYLRQYYLMKTVFSLASTDKPSLQVKYLQTRMLTILYEMLLPTARFVHHYELHSKKLPHDRIIENAQFQNDSPPVSSRDPQPPPQGEIVTHQLTVTQFPVLHANRGRFLTELSKYRRNHLMRVRPLALNLTPRGHVQLK
eukprot:NODE_787_length_1867_cov_86.639655_g734_i0.p1 GENE.NODE_787_length_1867_cov_86.639655_g734_i0~~NODE_787_length_1867_cov_86.639655_g734_i0.p1  ORF type:complete len:597 (-),score=132.91 NODE_787_length_1867_cov_86.639655_g734_i0:76-1815(-)